MNEYQVEKVGAYNTQALDEPTDRESELSNTIILYSTETEICRVEDLFPQPEDIGMFAILSKSDTAIGGFLRSIGLNTDEMRASIDVEYVYNHSGSKLLSRLVKKLIENNNANVSGSYPISQLDFSRICNILSTRFANKWKRLYETVTADFDPLKPFQMEIDENIQNKLSSQRNNNNEERSTYTNNQNETGTSQADGTERNNTFGFNGASSDDGEPRTKTITNEQNTFNNDTSGEGATTQNEERTEVYVRDNPITRKTNRSGNIGNITLQELTNQQREMLQWQFWDIAFQDCDTVLTRGMW